MEKITWRIWESDGLGRALLIGGLLFYVPLVNLLLLGYFGLWIRQLAMRRGLQLPEWREGEGIVTELGRVIVPFLVWVAAPVLLAALLVWALCGLLTALYLTVFTTTIPVAWLPFTLVALLSPPAFVVSLVRLYKTNSLREALAFPEILQEVARHLKLCLFPLLQFYGILAIGLPLLGFASFLAALPLFAQLVLIFMDAEDDLKSPVF